MSEDSKDSPDLRQLEEQLRLKRQELLELYGTPPVIHSPQIKQYQQLDEEILGLERQVAKARGEEYAAEWPLLEYDAFMANRIRVIADDSKCFVVLDTNIMVFFNHIISYKLEGINDEMIEGHPLYGKGLAYWETFVIENSSWLAQVKRTHSFHPQFVAEEWENVRHYLIFFKHRIFEALSSEPPVLMPHNSFEKAIQSAISVFDRNGSVILSFH